MSSEPINVTGYYGKVPTNGDFVSRGLPINFINPWDIWLQKAIYTSRQQLGEKWLSFYMTSPLYSFILSPGICGERAWLGILMPSVDKVGRHYPMTIGLMNNAATNIFEALIKYGDWFKEAGLMALSCLKEEFILDSFYLHISQLAPNDAAHPPKRTNTPLAQMNNFSFPAAFRKPIRSISDVPDILPALFGKLPIDHCSTYSVWWTEGSDHVSPSLLICAGLPPVDGFVAMFDGKWNEWGWVGNCQSVKP
jgi:type VI secretion system protein ImpM